MDSLFTTLQNITKQTKQDLNQFLKEQQIIKQNNTLQFYNNYLISLLKETAQHGEDNIALTFFFMENLDWFYIEKGFYDYNNATQPATVIKGLGNEISLGYLQSLLKKDGVALWYDADEINYVPNLNDRYYVPCIISWSTDQTHIATKFRKHHNQDKTEQQKEREKMTSGLRFDIFKRDDYKCKICGRGAKDGVKLHVDHIVPIAKGGKTIPENLQTLCQDCNLGKGTKDF